MGTTPDEASTNTDEHAKTEKKLYFNALEVDSLDIKTCEKRTTETSPLGGRLLMQSGTQYHNDVLKTSCEEQASL